MKLTDYQLLVFDWDGTLSDSTARIIQAAQKACEELQIPVPSDEVMRQYVGFRLDDIMRELFPEVMMDQLAQLVERYRYYYFAMQQEEYLFPDVMSTLERLKAQGFLLAVATNKSRKGLNLALQHTGLSHLFTATRTADEANTKPDPKILEDLMEITGISPIQTVMIGDSAVDLQLAENAGVDAIAVYHGGVSGVMVNEFKPIATVHDMKGILELL